jgi:hypothetical protein
VLREGLTLLSWDDSISKNSFSEKFIFSATQTVFERLQFPAGVVCRRGGRADMKIKIPGSKDFYAGILFIVFGLVAVVVAAIHYPIGTMVHVGPAGFPLMIGGFLTVLGVIIAARALRLSGETMKLFSLRGPVFVFIAVLIFALSVDSLGLVLAILALVFMSAFGGWEFRIREVCILYLVLAATAASLFVYGLEVPFKLWPW